MLTEKKVKIYDREAASIIKEIDLAFFENMLSTTATFSKDGKFIFFEGEDHKIRIINIEGKVEE